MYYYVSRSSQQRYTRTFHYQPFFLLPVDLVNKLWFVKFKFSGLISLNACQRFRIFFSSPKIHRILAKSPKAHEGELSGKREALFVKYVHPEWGIQTLICWIDRKILKRLDPEGRFLDLQLFNEATKYGPTDKWNLYFCSRSLA